VLWVVNAVEKNWEKQLPAEVRKWLDNARTKKGGLYAKSDAAADAETTTDGKGERLAV
jgi:poly(3-hydroxyalkanoate) synthetase